MNYKFTSGMENKLDTIATGNKIWHTVVGEYYEIIHPKVVKLLSQITDNKDKEYNKFKRFLGKDPKTDKNIYVIVSKFGPCLELGDDPNNREFVSLALTENKTSDTITLQDALSSMQFPKNLGNHNGNTVMIKNGRYGFYLELEGSNKQRVTIPKDMNPAELDLDQAINLIDENKTNSGVNKTFKNGTVKIMSGKFGPYIKTPMGNVPLKGYTEEDIDKMTEPLVDEIIDKYYISKPYAKKVPGAGAKGKKKTTTPKKSPKTSTTPKTPKTTKNPKTPKSAKSAKIPTKNMDDAVIPKSVKIVPKPKVKPKITKKTNCML